MIRILIAEEHSLFREGLKQVLEKRGLTVAGEAESGAATLEMIRSGVFDLVLLDLSMPGLGGLEVLRRLKRQRPALPVIVLGMHPENQYAPRAFRLGASGVLSKRVGAAEIESAIRKALAGGV